MERLSSSLCLVVAAATASLLSCKLSDYDVDDGLGTGGSGLGGTGASAGSAAGASGTGATGSGAAGTGGTGAGAAGGAGTGAAGGGGAANGGNGGTGGVIPPYPCDLTDEARMPGGKCYAILVKVPWSQARVDCQSWGGDLAIVNTSAIRDFVVGAFSPDAWVGLRDQDPPNQLFEWVDGSALAGYPMIGQQPPWASNEPSVGEDCIKLKSGVFESKACDSEPGGGILCEQD